MYIYMSDHLWISETNFFVGAEVNFGMTGHKISALMFYYLHSLNNKDIFYSWNVILLKRACVPGLVPSGMYLSCFRDATYNHQG